MKEVFVGDLLQSNGGDMTVELSGWISAKRDQGKVIFLDICDSTGKIQIVIAESNVTSDMFQAAKHWPIESAVTLKGLMTCSSKGQREIVVGSIALVGGVTKDFSPHPRGCFRHRHLAV